MFNVMYIKKNTLSLAHLLLHFYHPFLWTKITLRTSACPILMIKNVMYINNLVNAIQSEREELSDIYHKSIVQVLTTHGITKDQEETTSILQEIEDCVELELKSHCGKNASTAPVNHKTV